LILPAFAAPAVVAQPTYFSRTFDYQQVEVAVRVAQFASGYYTVGTTLDSTGLRTITIMAATAQGDQEWLGLVQDSTRSLAIINLVELPGQEYLLLGYTPDSSGQHDYLLGRLDSDGDTVWWRAFGDTTDWEAARAAIMDADGNYLVLAFHNYMGPPLWGQTVLMKVDTGGQVLWTKEFGGSAHDQPWGFVRARDGGILVAGGRQGPNWGDDKDLALMKMDSSGNLEWTKYYGTSFDGEGLAIVKSMEGGYMIAGYREIVFDTEFRGWLLKVDEDGEMEWEQFYRYENTSDNGFWRQMFQLPDSSYVVMGWVKNPDRDWGLIMRIDVSGELVWSRAYTEYAGANSYFYGADTTSDGGFIICGSTHPNGGNSDGWLLKLDEFGCLVPGCQLTTSLQLPPKEGGQLVVFPNPNNGAFTVTLPFEDSWRLELFDVNGRLIQAWAGQGVSAGPRLELNELTAGLYLLRAAAQDGSVVSEKMVVE
jgi:hypothetical protein